MPISKTTMQEVHRVIAKHFPDFDRRKDLLDDLLRVKGNKSYHRTMVDLWCYNAMYKNQKE